MLSPFTAPGTKIVCVDDSSNFQHVASHDPVGRLDGLRKETVYTLAAIRRDANVKSGFEAYVEEIRRPSGVGFALERFRRLELPRAISALLDATPADFELERA
ncbi:hypothetical protein [Methylocella sp.]|uniref:hypothetical protein n=1 Tax=Methylocella sp. TaxID=1978226 RepID=UPI0037830E6C